MTINNGIRQTIKVNYFQPAFLICVLVLAISAGAMSAAVKLSGIYLTKEQLPLKKPLDQLDSSNLLPYKVLAKQIIENRDVLATLGTEDYIQWNLEDTSVPEDSESRFCTLFITYYGLSDKVPHVPEECYIGGGLRQVSSEVVTLTIRPTPRGAIDERETEVRYLIFAATSPNTWGSEISFPVFYVFNVNGEYAAGRNQTRRILNKNIFGKFSYFSKIEWKFYNNKFGRMTPPNKEKMLAASGKLLSVVLPILEKEHWPSGLW